MYNGLIKSIKNYLLVKEQAQELFMKFATGFVLDEANQLAKEG